jgi:hypothetical protein
MKMYCYTKEQVQEMTAELRAELALLRPLREAAQVVARRYRPNQIASRSLLQAVCALCIIVEATNKATGKAQTE